MAPKTPIPVAPPDLPEELVAADPPESLVGQEVESVLWERHDLADTDARRLRVTESTLVDVVLTGASLENPIRDVL